MALLAPASPYGGEPDLQNCRWPKGEAMNPHVCKLLRDRAADEAAARERQRLADEEFDRQRAQAEQLESERKAREQAESEARYQAAKAEDERRQQLARQEADRLQREDDRAAAKQAAANSARKARCGADYLTPSVGMTLARASDCVAPFKLRSQVATAAGVVSTYEAGRIVITVRAGIVDSWFRY